MLKDWLYVLAIDRYGAVFCADDFDEAKGELTVGGSMPISAPYDEGVKSGLVEEIRRRFGADKVDDLGTVSHEGKTYHVIYIYSDGDGIGYNLGHPSGGFEHRWYFERHLDCLTPLSRIMWELVRERPFILNRPVGTQPKPEESPRIARRRGQLESIERLLAYTKDNPGTVMTVSNQCARVVALGEQEIDEPRPVCIDALYLGGG